MEDAKYLDLMAKYLSGNLTGQERAELFAWVEASADNQQFFEEMIQLWSISREYEEEPFETDLDKAWKEVDRRLSDPSEEEKRTAPSVKMRPLSKAQRWFRYAAVILLLVAAALWVWVDPLGWRMTSIATNDGEVRELTLPDGSQVWLNEHTTIAYSWPFWRRQLTMTGEAFFEVEPMDNSPFVIQSGGAMTTVLGTSFNVRAYPEEKVVEVTVKTGVVRLQDQDRPEEEVVLEAGNAGLYLPQAQQVRKTASNTENADAWKTRKLNFVNEPLPEVVETLERYYDIEIEIANEDILNCDPIELTAPFVNPELDSIVYFLSVYYDEFTIEEEGNKLVFSGQGCPR